MKEIWSGHEKLTDRQMDGQTDDQCLDEKNSCEISRYTRI